MAAPLAVPASPSSSKRSRSKDSTRSAATSFANTPAANTPALTPSASAPSLVIPSSRSQTPSVVEPSPQDPTPYPAFLRLNRADIHGKFVDLEWEQRRRLLQGAQANEPDQQSRWARCGGDEVMNRNRYANVDPYSNNRVKLQVPEGHSDYINASPIVLETTKSQRTLKFIATQGPKGDSFSHVWRMIWNEIASPAVVVMLTQTHEQGREKCYPYYPQTPSSPTLKVNAHDEFEDGFTHDLVLTSLVDNEEARAQVRELDMKTEDGSETKKIWHLLFGGWPDFLIPEGDERAALLKLIQLSRDKNEDNSSNPRVVHCSAGVGRSGTFIALDYLLQELDEGSLDDVPDTEDPIFKVVGTLRQQRMMMVQGEAQFSFLYEVVRERWRDRWAKSNPDQAERLGLDAILVREPRAKKPRQSLASDGSGETEDEDERAELEAELANAGVEYDRGKT